MEVAVPEVSYYASADGVVKLEIPNPQSGKAPSLTTPGKLFRHRHDWSAPLLPPSEVVISSSTQRVVLLGGLGDPGVSLGLIEIRDFDGKQLCVLDVRPEIPGLDRMAAAWRDRMGNFPWIASAQERGAELQVGVVEKFMATIDLTKCTLRVSSLNLEPSRPLASRGPPKRVAPLTLNGVRYDPALGVPRGYPGNHIGAYDAQTGKELWRVEVYQDAIIPDLEEDVQKVYISGLESIEDGAALRVTNENGQRWRLDLKTRLVTPLDEAPAQPVNRLGPIKVPRE